MFALGEVIGRGTYGMVYRARDLLNREVAVKAFRNDAGENGLDVGIMREVVYLKSLPRHHHVIELFDVDWNGSHLRVSMPLFAEDLRKHMNRRTFAPDNAIVTEYSRQVASGLAHLHEHGVFLRDLKPDNILINPSGPGRTEGPERTEGGAHLVLCDFSLASTIACKATHSLTIQTLWYRALEVLLDYPRYTAAIDMWSFGCVVAFLLGGGKDLWPGDSEWGQLMLIFQTLGTPTPETWPDLVNMPEYGKMSTAWPKWEVNRDCFHQKYPDATDRLIKVMEQSLVYNFTQRLTADQACNLLK